MKTKDLIALLQKEDPTGEIECCIDNCDIHFVSTEPAYWDGRLQILTRDSSCKYYNIIGAKYTSKGSKVVIHQHSIKDYISTLPETAVIDYSEVGNENSQKSLQESDERWRQTIKNIELDIELKSFIKWASGKLSLLSEEKTFRTLCTEFYIKNREILDQLPKLPQKKDDKGYEWYPSISERQIYHWDNIVEICGDGFDSWLKIRG